MKKILIGVSILVVAFIIIGVSLKLYQKIEKDNKIEKNMMMYKAKWNIGSIQTCKLDEVIQSENSRYIVTNSNRAKYKDGIIKLKFNEESLSISFLREKIVAKQLYHVGKKQFGTMTDGFDFYYFFPSEYGYGNLRFIPKKNHFFVIDNNSNKEKIYSCKKI